MGRGPPSLGSRCPTSRGGVGTALSGNCRGLRVPHGSRLGRRGDPCPASLVLAPRRSALPPVQSGVSRPAGFPDGTAPSLSGTPRLQGARCRRDAGGAGTAGDPVTTARRREGRRAAASLPARSHPPGAPSGLCSLKRGPRAGVWWAAVRGCAAGPPAQTRRGRLPPATAGPHSEGELPWPGCGSCASSAPLGANPHQGHLGEVPATSVLILGEERLCLRGRARQAPFKEVLGGLWSGNF